MDTTSDISIGFSPKYNVLLDQFTNEIVEGSGRNTGKTTHNEIAAVLYMLQDQRNNIWYCKAEIGSVRTTIFSSLWSTIQLMGLERYFKASLSPFEIRCLRTGARCYFSGINGKTDDDVTATKGFTPQFKSLKMCILDEADQVKHYNHIDAWRFTANRFLLPDGKIVYAYNPPPNRSHWAFTYFGNKIRNGAYNLYATWMDIGKFLNKRNIDEILKFKKDDPEYYRYWYLGEPVNFTGMVYPQFKRETHIINIYSYMALHPNDRPQELILGLDEGTVNDSTCVSPLLIMQSGTAIVMDCLEIDPEKIGQQAPTQNSKRLYDFLISLYDRYPFMNGLSRKWIFESAEGGQMLKEQFVLDYGEIVYLVENKSIMGDVKRVRNMLAERILLFHVDDTNNTMQLIEDIENYVFDEKTGDIKKQQRDDTIDSLEYATKLYYNIPL